MALTLLLRFRNFIQVKDNAVAINNTFQEEWAWQCNNVPLPTFKKKKLP